jgi:hypothetical protein
VPSAVPKSRRPAGLRVGLLIAVTGAVLAFPLAAAAGAGIEGPCDGSVTIGGSTYGPANDTPANPIVVPDEPGLTAQWQGSTGVVIKDHSGSVGIQVGPFTIAPADWRWSGPNEEEATSASGTTSIDEAKALLPLDIVGVYEVRGTHAGDGGACEGMALVRVEGNPLSTAPGAGAAVGLAGSAVGLGFAARGRKP